MNLVYRYDYNLNQDLEILTIYLYNEKFDRVVGEYQRTYDYDINLNLRQETFSIWNSLTGTWVPWFRIDNEYNNDMVESDLILPYSPNDSEANDLFRHQLIKNFVSYYNEDLELWTSESCGIFHYSESEISNSNDESKNNLVIYPNPVVEYIVIQNNRGRVSDYFYLYNSEGKLILSKKFNYGDKIDLSNIIRGNYIYLIKSDNNKFNKSGILILI